MDYDVIGSQNCRDDKPDRRRGRTQRLFTLEPLLTARDLRAGVTLPSCFRLRGPAT